MSITRTTDIDDDGSGTTGTVRSNAWLQAIYDALDSRWSVVTITSTGSQNNLAISEADLVIFNNASDITVTGIAAPSSPSKPGKPLRCISIGAGNVFFKHQNGSSTAANRLINFATSGDTPLAAGVGTAMFVYDSVNSRWRLMLHEQGEWLDYSATSTIVGFSSRTATSLRYFLRGRTVTLMWYLGGTSNSTSTTFTIPYTANNTGASDGAAEAVAGVTIDNGSYTATPGQVRVDDNTNVVIANASMSRGAWTASGTKTSAGQLMVWVQ